MELTGLHSTHVLLTSASHMWALPGLVEAERFDKNMVILPQLPLPQNQSLLWKRDKGKSQTLC